MTGMTKFRNDGATSDDEGKKDREEKYFHSVDGP